jgi:hypothetical protein
MTQALIAPGALLTAKAKVAAIDAANFRFRQAKAELADNHESIKGNSKRKRLIFGPRLRDAVTIFGTRNPRLHRSYPCGSDAVCVGGPQL